MGIFDKFKHPKLFTTQDYTAMLFRCLPQGLIWRFRKYVNALIIQDVIDGTEWQDTFDSAEQYQDAIESSPDGDLFSRLISCFASELERLETAAWDVFNQCGDPGVATTLLHRWEKQLGLPEACYSTTPLTIAERQGHAHAKLFYVGVTATKAFYENYALSLGYDITVEENVQELDAAVCGIAECGYSRYGDSSGYSILRITIHSGSSANSLLKCIFNKNKPAHVIIDWVEE